MVVFATMATTQLESAKISKLQLEKLREAIIKRKVSKVFKFDDSWTRKSYKCFQQPEHLRQIEQLYLSDTFDNQRSFGKQIAQAFDHLGVINVLAIAPTQSGKTGSMLATIHELTRDDYQTKNDIRTPVSNIFIFTGHSSKEWVEQTKKRFPDCLKQNIFHRNQLKRFVARTKNIKNALIIIDECHIANKFGQTLYKLFLQLAIFDIRRTFMRNIKILQFTATPNNSEQQLRDNWANSFRIVHMQVPDKYISHEHLIQRGYVKPILPLLDNEDALRTIKDNMVQQPMYHIIRTPRGNDHFRLIQQFKAFFNDIDCEFISEPLWREHNSESFDSLLSIQPRKHTFLFIVDKLRCAKTIHIQFVNIVYDRFIATPQHDSIIQGLLGRCTGYHNCFEHIIIFTFIEIASKQTYSNIKQSNIFDPR